MGLRMAVVLGLRFGRQPCSIGNASVHIPDNRVPTSVPPRRPGVRSPSGLAEQSRDHLKVRSAAHRRRCGAPNEIAPPTPPRRRWRAWFCLPPKVRSARSWPHAAAAAASAAAAANARRRRSANADGRASGDVVGQPRDVGITVADATVRGGCAQGVVETDDTVHGDLPRPSLELLVDVGVS